MYLHALIQVLNRYNKTATKECPYGYEGKTTRHCNLGPDFEKEEGKCTPLYCTGHDFTDTLYGKIATKSCPDPKFHGAITALCKDGKFENIKDECAPLDCEKERNGFEFTKHNKNTTTKCDPGYIGNMTADCSFGKFINIDRSGCSVDAANPNIT